MDRGKNGLNAVLPVFLFFVFAVILTWPLLLYSRTCLPIGTERTTTIPLFGLWSLLWDADRAGHLFQGYWDAPIFYPTRGTFAFCETMLPQGLFLAAGLILSGDPLPVYNLMLLVCLSLNGLAAFSLSRVLGVSGLPAMLTGLFAVALPYAATELGVCQLIVLFPVFYFFARLYQFSRQPELKQALLMGLWAAILALCCSYYGLFLSVFAVLGAVCFFNRKMISGRAVFYLLAGIGLAVLLTLPVLLPQYLITSRFSHGSAIFHMNSCRPADYLALSPLFRGAGAMPWLGSRDAVRPMYPGTGLLLLALGGLWFGRNRAPRWVLFCALGAVLAMILSMAGNIEIAGRNLLELLQQFYPGFKQLRNAFRFGGFVQIFLVGLIGFTLEKIYHLKENRGKLLLPLIMLLSILEVLPVTQIRPVPDDSFSAAWSDFLKTQPAGPALMLPMAAEDLRVDYNYLPIVVGMIHALDHGKPLVNGMSTFRPAGYLEVKEKMKRFPDPASLACLRDIGVAYLIIDKNILNDGLSGQLAGMPDFQLLYADGMKSIYRLISD